MKRLLKHSFHIFTTCIKSGFVGVYGWYKISCLQGPVVSICGGALAKKNCLYTQLAYEIASQCVHHEMSVLTGGGPGIMEAANCGAYQHEQKKNTYHIHTLGIGIRGVDLNYSNPCTRLIYTNTFFIRKWLFINYSQAFVFLPGGVGTADELFDLLNMIAMDQIKPIPVILVCSSYWQPLIDWYYNSGVAHGLINQSLSQVLIVVDSVDEVINSLKKNTPSSPKP